MTNIDIVDLFVREREVENVIKEQLRTHSLPPSMILVDEALELATAF